MARLAHRDTAARRERELPADANPADFSEALARGLAVLAAFDADRRRLTQADLARELGLPRATVRRAVLTLHHLGYLRAEGRHYQLTPKVLGLTTGYLTADPVSALAQPACERVCAELDESCTVAILDGADALMIARALPRRVAALTTGIGYRVPAATSALGKVLLAHPAGIEPPAALTAVAEAGYSYVAHDVEEGFHSIAVPVRRWDGQVVAAMNVGCRIERIPPESMHSTVLELLRRTVAELRAQLV